MALRQENRIFHIVVNPAGASGKARKTWDRLEPVFAESGQDYQVHFSTKEKGIGAICHELEQEGPDTILVIVGGDGTMNEAINGLEHPESVLLGHIPAGSGNDLLRDMGLPKDPVQLAAVILEGKVKRTCDIGELTYLDTGERKRFAVSCGIGFDAGVCELAGRSPKKDLLNRIGLGKLIYLAAAFRVIRSQRCGEVDIILEEESGRSDVHSSARREVHYDRLLLLACMNHQYEGGGFNFTPDASADDGILNLCAADPESNRAFYRILPMVMVGRHYRSRYMHELRGSRIEIRTSAPMWVHTDGEVKRKADHLEIRVPEEQLRFLQ